MEKVEVLEVETEAEVGLDMDLVTTTLRLRGRKADGVDAAEEGIATAKPRLSRKVVKAGSTISPLRWGATRLMSRIKTLCHTSATITINNPDRLARTSSFASFPLALAGIPSPPTPLPNLLNRVLPFLPPAFHSLYSTHLQPALTHLTNTNTSNTSNPKNNFTIKPVLLVSPPPPHARPSRIPPTPSSKTSIMMITVTATTLAHLRRTFTPWVGQHTWHAHPLDDLRLAVSNPDCFLAEMLGGMTVWGVVVAGWGVKAAWDLVGGLLRTTVVTEAKVIDEGAGNAGVGEGREEGRLKGEKNDGARKGLGRKTVRTPVGAGKCGFDEMVGEMLRVGYLVWVLVAVEYVFVRGMNTAAWLVACYKLLAGGEVGRVALLKALEGNRVKAAFVACQLGWYLWRGVCPLIWRSLLCAARGQPALLVLVMGSVGGVMSLLRYRSTFFIALQISDMFIFFAFLLVGVVMLGTEFFFDDLLGLNRGTARAKGRGPGQGDSTYNRRIQGPRP